MDYKGNTLKLEIHASKGTYIRTLIDDIGEALGYGAHMIALRRIGIGFYQSLKMYSMDELEDLFNREDSECLDNCLLSVDSPMASLPKVVLSDKIAHDVTQGRTVLISSVVTSGWVRLMLSNDQFLGIGEILEGGRVAPRRLINLF